MPALHLIFTLTGVGSCLEVADKNDTLVLLQDGVYAALEHPDIEAHAIGDDVQARGIMDRLPASINAISYDELVALVTEHQPVVSWIQ